MKNEPTTGEIVRDLRRCYEEKSFGCKECSCRISAIEHFCDHNKLADRLERQDRENASLRAENKGLHKEIIRRGIEIETMTARAESAERERDAAIGHVHDAIFGTNHSCFYCTMENCDGCTNSTVKEHFKYRGIHPNKYLVKQEYEQDGGAE